MADDTLVDDDFQDETQGGGDGEDAEFQFQQEDEDLKDLETVTKTAKDGLILAIDCRKNMFKPYPETGKTPWSLAMTIASKLMRRKVITGAKTQLGVLFWGTRETLNQNKFEHIYDFMSLDSPSAGKISQLDTYAELNESTKAVFDQKIGHQTDEKQTGVTLETMLWLSAFFFSDGKYTKNDSQRIWIFTNDDYPCKMNPDSKQKVIVRAKDLEKAGQEITLWTMKKRGDKSFDINLFWNDVLNRPEEVDDDQDNRAIWVTSESDLNEYMDQSRKKEFAKRTLVSIPLILGPNVEIGVKLYAIILETKLPNAIPLEEQTGKPLKISTRWICNDQATYLSPDQILNTTRYGGGSRVLFSSEDRKRVKRFAPASIAILGFKSLKELPDWQSVRAPYLLRPDEKSVRGSAKAFVALLGETLAQKKFAVARFIANKSASPKLVALVPQEEQLDQETNEVIVPMGFLAIVLPFADDIRIPSFPEPFAEATHDQVEQAKKVVQRLSNTKPFDPREYENPALQKFWASLEALALDKKDDSSGWKETENDLLRFPNEEELVFDQEFVQDAQAFSDSYGGPGEVETKKKSTPKKKRTSPTPPDEDELDEAPKQRKTTKKKDIDTSDINWKELAENDGLSKLTVADLKVYLEMYKLPKGGKKADLIDRIKEHLDSQS